MGSGAAWRFGANALVLTVFSLAWVTSRDFPEKTRLFPTFVLAVGLLLVLVRFWLDFRHRDAAPRSGHKSGAGLDLRPGDAFAHGEAVGKASRQFAWIGGVVVSSIMFGPLLPLPLYVLLHTRFSGRERWRTAVTAAVGFAIFLVVIFEVLLNTSWPPGVISWPQKLILRGIEAIVDA